MKTTLSLLILLTFVCKSYTQIPPSKDLTKLSFLQLDSFQVLHFNKGTFEECIPYMQAGREKAKALFGVMDSTYAEYTNTVGVCYYFMAQHDNAKPFLFESKDIRAKVLGKNSMAFAESLGNLAGVYFAIGQYEEAILLQLECKKIIVKNYGEGHPATIECLINLATHYTKISQYQKAEECCLLVKDIVYKNMGDQHHYFGTILNLQAENYLATGEYQKAEPLLIQAKGIYAKNFGEQHPNFATSLKRLATLYQALGQHKKAEQCLLQAKNIVAKALGEEHLEFAIMLNNLAISYFAMGQHKKAEQFYLQAKDIQFKIFGAEHPESALCLTNLGIVYSTIGDYEKSEMLLLQAKDIQAKISGERSLGFASILYNLACLYMEMGSFEKSELLYLQGINIYTKLLGEETFQSFPSLASLGLLYTKMGNFEKAEQYFLQHKELVAKVLGEDHPDFIWSLSNLAGHYSENVGNYKKAEPLFLKVIDFLPKTDEGKHEHFAVNLSNLAFLYQKTGRFDKAEALLLEASNILSDDFGQEHREHILMLNLLTNLYKEMGKLDTALYYAQQAIAANATDIDNSFSLQKLSISDFSNLDKYHYHHNGEINFSLRALMGVLQAQFEKTADKTKLEAKYQVAQAAMRLNERIRNDFSGEGDKLRSLATNSGYVLEGIKTGIKLAKQGYQEEAFAFAEINKGALLMDAFKTSNAYQLGDLPDSLAERERILQKTHADLKAALLDKNLKTEKDSLLGLLNNTNQEIENFTKLLKAKYPKYTALKYGNKMVNAKEIQTLLDDKTALLEYVIGDSIIYIFYVDKQKVVLEQKYLSTKILATKIKELHSTLNNYAFIKAQSATAYQQYTENAFWFYENLVASVLKNAKGIENLIIVSDGELGHLPFEAFLVEAAPQKQTDYHELHYLNNDYKISYNYSATFWKSIKESAKKKNNGQLLAMTANYDIQLDSTKTDWRLPAHQRLRALLNPLPAAKEEVKVLSENFNGFFAFDKDASEKNFKEKAGDYAIIHLAMHGLLDPKGPILSSIAFTEDGDSLENNFLHAYEISKMKLNADLVVLSACQTGYGRFEKGNGIASLAQAFTYAGAPALIVSLWSVNDYATSEIMKGLYQNLADGMEKDEALQQAKMKYMKEAKGVLAHPAFWSPFILMGNTDAIYLKTKTGWTWWIIGGLVLALGGGFLAMRSRKKE